LSSCFPLCMCHFLLSLSLSLLSCAFIFRPRSVSLSLSLSLFLVLPLCSLMQESEDEQVTSERSSWSCLEARLATEC
jgi:hypothetical protein